MKKYSELADMLEWLFNEHLDLTAYSTDALKQMRSEAAAASDAVLGMLLKHSIAKHIKNTLDEREEVNSNE